jgi:hypothetical protein
MNWLLPGFLAAALAVGLPIALHFLRSRPKQIVRFPTLRFLGASAVRDTNRHRLRRRVTLALRCLVLLLLAAAFARPFWLGRRAAHGQVMVVAIDNSFSMQAAGRLETLRRWALDQLHDLRPGDSAGLLLMQPRPTWLAPITDDLGRVTTTLIAMRPGFETTHYGDALRVGAEALAAYPGAAKTLVWMADEQRLGWLGVNLDQALPAGVKLRLPDPSPAPGRQAAIVSVARGGKPGAAELEVGIRLFAPAKQTRTLSVVADGKTLTTRKLALGLGENRVAVPLPEGAGEALRVALDPDDLPADDVAWIAGEPAGGRRVYLDAAEGPDFLVHALHATQRLGAAGVDPASLPAGAWPADAVVILRGPEAFRAPMVERLNRFVDAGGPLWIFADGSPEQTAWLEAHGIFAKPWPATDEPAHLRDWDPESPLLAAFVGESLAPLLDVDFQRGFDLAGDALASVANWPDGRMALATTRDHGRRILVAGFSLDPEATDWPAQPSFVPFVHQGVRWLGSQGSAKGDWRVGETIPLPAGEGTWRALDGPEHEAARKVEGRVRPSAPGLYEFAAGPVRRVFAVNLPAAESDLAPWPDAARLAALESQEPAAPVAAQASLLPVSHEIAESQQRLWWWLLALGGLFLLAELTLANRTSM